ncbi:MAG: hypothetical protein Q9210_001415 [Variospora velana]
MQLGLLASALILSFLVPCTLVNGLSHRAEHDSSSRGLSSEFDHTCLPQIDDKNNPLCLRPKHPQDTSVHSYTVSDPDNPRMRPFSFQLTVPKSLTVVTWEKSLDANLKSTLPSILRQLGVAASQVVALASEGVPLVVDAITAILSGKSNPDISSDIARRELISDIRSWIRK